MPKPLSDKGKLIRAALAENPEAGNTELAAALAQQHPGIEFKPSQVAAQKLAIKRAARGDAEEGEEEGAEEGEEEGPEGEDEAADELRKLPVGPFTPQPAAPP